MAALPASRQRAPGRARARRLAGVASALVLIVVAAVPSGAATSSLTSRGASGAWPPIAKWTIVARLVRDAPRYNSATATDQVGTLPATWQGAASVLPVLSLTTKRLLVRVAQRPNGQEAWIPIGDARLSRSPYEIVIHLRSMHLDLFRLGHGTLSTPIGVGTRKYPTPTGNFFVAFFAAPPSRGYGPFVIVTSGHSNTITNWQYSGDAMVAIHGPLGADAEIGTTGARVSHGCVRLHVRDLRFLRPVPVGSPVYIVK